MPTKSCLGLAACALMLPVVVLGKRPPPPPPVDTVTSREVVEKQLEPQPPVPGRLSGPEARRIHDLYLLSIGRIIVTNQDEARSGK